MTKKQSSKTRKIFGVIALILFILFCLWSSLWFLVFLPLLFDFFFTRKIPWGWYRNLKSRFWRSFWGWVDCIVFALVGVYIIFLFFFQNFVIPTSSLEKTLLVGDYVFVSKLSYGPRMPITPIYFPLAHNSIGDHKSYLDFPKLKYRRLKGFGNVKSGDIVVFNFPAGDTVAMKRPERDFYSLCAEHGRDYVLAHPEQFGKIISRPVDKRDYYVKRCVGLPGQTLQVKNDVVYINGKEQPTPKYAQLNYFVQTDGTPFSEEFIDDLGVSKDDVFSWRGSEDKLWKELGLAPVSDGNYGLIYYFPLTEGMLQRIKAEPYVRKVVVEQSKATDGIYPLDYKTGWTRDNYGPILIPKRGMTINLNPFTAALYARAIHAYEGHDFERKGDVYYIDGKPASHYTFAMDYYFMMGDNRGNSADSRYWGFVPEDHIVGSPIFVTLSLNKDKPLFGGKIRWKRMFHTVSSLEK